MSNSVPPPSDRPTFPPGDEYARKFFEEAVRHLDDASILHQAGRFPAAITSSMKAAELAIKAMLILEGSLGWWDKVQQTHQPLTDARQHPVHKYHFQQLERVRASLVVRVTAMEKLAPAKPGVGPLTFETQANPEYPFFFLEPGRPSGPETARLIGPSECFKEGESRSHYFTARELLAAYQGLDARVSAWGFPLPAPL